MYSNNEFFILTLSYVSILIEYILINFIFIDVGLNSNLINCTFISRIILLTIAINNSKLALAIVNNKRISVIICILFNIVGTYIEINFNIINILGRNLNNLLQLLMIIYYYVLLVFLAIRCIRKNEVIYTIFIATISIFTIRRVFYFSVFNLNSYSLIEYNKCLSFIVYIILICGIYIEMIRRIEEGIRLNREVKNNERVILSISENIKDLIITTDKDGRIEYVNKSVLNKLGYNRDEIIGLKYNDLIHSENNLTNDEKSHVLFIEQKWICKNNKLFTTETMINNVNENEDEGFAKVIVARDYEYRERFEKLKRKYKEIKAVDKAKGQFFANLSHEIKTPINIIYSCIQLLEIKKSQGDVSLAEAYRKYDNTIKQNCYRLLRLVNNLVDITKIDSGYMTLSFVNYDIVNLVEEITLSIIPYVESKGINVIFDTYIEELNIKCDPDSIERVILNLLSNAIKFTNEGGNILVVMDADEEYVTISVKDDGTGISEDFKSIIVDRFVQEDKTLNRKKEGSGIGVALVKSLVELHNGNVYLESEVNKGSEFIIKLPNIKLEEEIKQNELDVTSKPVVQKINIEFSDIYELYH